LIGFKQAATELLELQCCKSKVTRYGTIGDMSGLTCTIKATSNLCPCILLPLVVHKLERIMKYVLGLVAAAALFAAIPASSEEVGVE
jgi:hypothetical protein